METAARWLFAALTTFCARSLADDLIQKNALAHVEVPTLAVRSVPFT